MTSFFTTKYFCSKNRYVRFYPDDLKKKSSSIELPSSKSLTIRALILAGFSKGSITINNYLASDDSYYCIKALENLGSTIKFDNNYRSLIISGSPITEIINHNLGSQTHHTNSTNNHHHTELFMASSGISARFILAILSCIDGLSFPIKIDGTKSLKKRNFHRLIHHLKTLAINDITQEISPKNLDNFELPLIITPNTKKLINSPKTICLLIDHLGSSQFLSALLLASPFTKKTVKINLKHPPNHSNYLSMTIDMMKKFNVNVDHNHQLTEFCIKPKAYEKTSKELTIEADLSSGCYIIFLAALHSINLTLINLPRYTHQADLHMFYVMKDLGIEFSDLPKFIEDDIPSCDLQSDLFSITTKFDKQQFIGGITVDLNNMADQALTLAAMALFADQKIIMINTQILRDHECDRLQAIITIASILKAQISHQHHRLTIYPKFLIENTTKENNDQKSIIPSYDDHRVAMAFSVVASKITNLVIDNPQCVGKTFPSFFQTLKQIGVNYQFFS